MYIYIDIYKNALFIQIQSLDIVVNKVFLSQFIQFFNLSQNSRLILA